MRAFPNGKKIGICRSAWIEHEHEQEHEHEHEQEHENQRRERRKIFPGKALTPQLMVC
jgi:hypothetical protein